MPENEKDQNEKDQKEKERKEKELNDFWDIDLLVPSKKERRHTGSSSNVSFDTKTVEVSSAPVQEASSSIIHSSTFSDGKFVRFIPPHTAEEFENRPIPEDEYVRENSLIHSVKIYNKSSKYNFYEKFLEDAKKYSSRVGEECPAVPFFSYTPQYEQMNRAQLAYYFWWRENVRKGIYLDADYSYILLYLYELINLSVEMDKNYCLDMMCNIWLKYGKQHAFIGRYLSEWVCDFCLIHHLPAPSDKLKSIYPEIMKNCLIKEFYVVGGKGDSVVGETCAEMLIATASSYDYKKSRYATEERLAFMEKHMIGALESVLNRFSDNNALFGGFRTGIAENTAVRNSYSGALCSVTVRRKIEIQYYSISRSYELRYLVGDILKYSENRLRKLWGIKSRLSIYALPMSIKKCIDEYFDLLIPKNDADAIMIERYAEKTRGAYTEPEYERFYDAPKQKLSPERADEIEHDSWETTRILVETFDDDTKVDVQASKESAVESCLLNVSNDTEPSHPGEVSLKTALGNKYCFLVAVRDENIREQRRLSSELSYLPETLVDEINEIAADICGDIIIEESDEGYRVIEEYRTLVE